MGIIVYLTKDEWAKKKAQTDWETYTGIPAGSNHEYPLADGLDDMIEEMSGLMNDEIGHSSDISSHATTTRNICYRGVEMMMDDELARSEGRTINIPRDYMYERDRMRLRRFGRELGYRKFGGMTSG